MSIEIMEVPSALRAGAQLPFALVRSISEVTLGATPSAVQEEDLLEARFFSADEEIRVFRQNGVLQAAARREAGDERFLDRTYEISNPKFGSQLTIRSYMDFDEDGQAYWNGFRLIDWEGGVQRG